MSTVFRPADAATTGGKITLADLAARTGLNISTVSRALSKPERVSAETRKLVRRAAEQLGYATNLAARSLSRGRADMFMVVLSNFPGQPISPVLTEALRGVFDEAAQRGYGVIIKRVEYAELAVEELMDLALNGMVDGVLMLAPARSARTVRRIRPPAHIPVVSVMHDMVAGGISSVVALEQAGFYGLTDYLLRKGHRHFAFLSGLVDTTHEKLRFEGVMQRLAEEGMADACDLLPGGAFDMESGLKAVPHFLSLENRPTAVICCSDALALGFIRGALKAGLRIPQDVAVSGYDGLEQGEYSTPTLTTLIQPSAEIGRLATRLLIDRCQQHQATPPQLVALGTMLAERESA
ncbi:LacI family DNA-binding transcriptional regulator [Nguyenibacter vanlangensis]|uniref:LacI family DNA-binding transcriptional regulator n=1 Tax=Nguyenibacter vanlangensis TaxID=1216886 RepID=A0ABZ3D8Z6_9PROT